MLEQRYDMVKMQQTAMRAEADANRLAATARQTEAPHRDFLHAAASRARTVTVGMLHYRHATGHAHP